MNRRYNSYFISVAFRIFKKPFCNLTGNVEENYEFRLMRSKSLVHLHDS